MTQNQFNSLLNEIKYARSIFAFQQAQKQLCVFTPDENFMKLAICFNENYAKHLGHQKNGLELDIAHIQMLIELQGAARAFKKHIAYISDTFFKSDPFDFDLHFRKLSQKIDAHKNNAHYNEYCNYFYNEIYIHVTAFYPKVQYHAPECVKQFSADNEYMQLIRS